MLSTDKLKDSVSGLVVRYIWLGWELALVFLQDVKLLCVILEQYPTVVSTLDLGYNGLSNNVIILLSPYLKVRNAHYELRKEKKRIEASFVLCTIESSLLPGHL